MPDVRELAPIRDPYRSLGLVWANSGVGCATLVGPDLLLTVSHAVRNSKGIHSDSRFEFGVGHSEPTCTAYPAEMFTPDDSLGDIASGKDWALIRLDRPVGLYYGWVVPAALSESELIGSTLELAGYGDCPDDLRPELSGFKQPYRAASRISHVDKNIVFHNGPMWGGTSGAPLLALGPKGQVTLVALNSAGVNIDGELLKNGFRATYLKETANIAIPAHNWMQQYEALPKSKYAPLRRVFVRNRSLRPLEVCLRFRSVLANPGDEKLLSGWVQVAPGKRSEVVTLRGGFNEREIQLCLRNGTKNPPVTARTEQVEVAGEVVPFDTRSLPGSADYTLSIP